MVYWQIPYDTMWYSPPPPQIKKEISANAKTQVLVEKKKRIMSAFLGLMLLLAATTWPALENNLSDGTVVPHVPGTHKIHHVS